MKQPNEYEILDFVWFRFKGILGKGPAAPSLTPTSLTQQTSPTPMSDVSATRNGVNDLPEKVDRFVALKVLFILNQHLEDQFCLCLHSIF